MADFKARTYKEYYDFVEGLKKIDEAPKLSYKLTTAAEASEIMQDWCTKWVEKVKKSTIWSAFEPSFLPEPIESKEITVYRRRHNIIPIGGVIDVHAQRHIRKKKTYDAEAELTKILSEKIAAEVDQEILNELKGDYIYAGDGLLSQSKKNWKYKPLDYYSPSDTTWTVQGTSSMNYTYKNW